MVAFFLRHPCDEARQVLATLRYEGRETLVSIVTIHEPARGSFHPYANAVALARVERAEGTGSINDLLREGVTVPSAPHQMPPREAFQVIQQDAFVLVLDAFYLDGPTTNQAPALLRLERDLQRGQLSGPRR